MNQFLLSKMHTFEVAARHLSFTKAAEELNLTQGAVSQQIRALEDRLKFSLFIRKPRRLELTSEGNQLYITIKSSLDEIQNKLDYLINQNQSGAVRLCTGPSFALNRVIPILGLFHEQYQTIKVHMSTQDNMRDIYDLINQVDFVIRFGEIDDVNLSNIELNTENIFVVASPKLIENKTSLKTLDDLKSYPLLRNEMSEVEKSGKGDWNTWFQSHGIVQSQNYNSRDLLYPRSDMLVRAAVYGQGLALVWNSLVLNELKNGELVKVFDGKYELESAYYAVGYPDTFQKQKVKVFLNWLKEVLTQNQ